MPDDTPQPETPPPPEIIRDGERWRFDGDSLRDEWLDEADRDALRAHAGASVFAAEIWDAARCAATDRLWRARSAPLVQARLAHWHAPFACAEHGKGGAWTFRPHTPRGLADVGLADMHAAALCDMARAAADPAAPALPTVLATDWGAPELLATEQDRRCLIDAFAAAQWPRHLAFARVWGAARRLCLLAGGGRPGAVALPESPAPAARLAAREALHRADLAADYAREAARPLAELLRAARPDDVAGARRCAAEALERAAARAAMRLRGVATAWGLAAAPRADGESALDTAWANGRRAVDDAATAGAAYAAMDTAVAALEALR